MLIKHFKLDKRFNFLDIYTLTIKSYLFWQNYVNRAISLAFNPRFKPIKLSTKTFAIGFPQLSLETFEKLVGTFFVYCLSVRLAQGRAAQTELTAIFCFVMLKQYTASTRGARAENEQNSRQRSGGGTGSIVPETGVPHAARLTMPLPTIVKDTGTD